MRSMSWLRRAAACLGLVLPATISQAQTAASNPPAPKPPPVEAFFGRPLLQGAKLSPSGRWLASLVAQPGQRTNLVISDLDNKEPAMAVAAFSKHDVTNVSWVSDDLLVFQAYDNMDRSRESTRRGAGLLSVRRNGDGLRLLIKREWEDAFPRPGLGPLEANHEYMGLGAPGTDEVIVGDYQYDSRYRDVKNIRLVALNARTGERRTLLDNPPPNITSWWWDPNGLPRFALSRQEGEYIFHWHDLTERRWRELLRAPVLKAPYWPSFVDGAGRIYVTWIDKDGNDHLSRLDVANGKPDPEPLVSTPGFDGPIHRIINRGTGELLGLSLLTDDDLQVWFSPVMQALQEKVDKMLPGRINLISCAPCDKPKAVLVYSYSDRHPGEFIVHRPETDRWTLIGTRRPGIDAAQMGRKSFHRITQQSEI